jgi:hypothetical protein
MKIEEDFDFDRPSFVSSKMLAVLEEQLYGHVRAAVDFDMLYQLEEHLSLILMKDFAMETPLACDLSTMILEAALRRVVDDPVRHGTVNGAPDGITEEELEAVAYDEACEFCRAARQARERAKAFAGVEEEYCACCEMLRDDWREKHADVLAKAGLTRPPSEPRESASAAAIAGVIELAKRDHRRRDKPS